MVEAIVVAAVADTADAKILKTNKYFQPGTALRAPGFFASLVTVEFDVELDEDLIGSLQAFREPPRWLLKPLVESLTKGIRIKIAQR